MKRIGLIFSIISLLFFPVLTLATDDLYDYYNPASFSSTDAFYGDRWLGQTFIASDYYEITSIKVKLWKSNNPTGYLYASIRETDENDLPTGNDLTTGTLSTSLIDAQDWYEVILTPYRLKKDTKYSIILSVNGDSVNMIRFMRNTTTSYQGQSVISVDAGITWASRGGGIDNGFETYGIEYQPPFIVPIDNAFVISALAYVGVVWEDFVLIALFSIGLPVGFLIVKKVISITSIR